MESWSNPAQHAESTGYDNREWGGSQALYAGGGRMPSQLLSWRRVIWVAVLEFIGQVWQRSRIAAGLGIRRRRRVHYPPAHGGCAE
jgi:hypothetical protein